MEFNPQIIKKSGKNEFAVLPYNEYLKIMELLEDYEDLVDLRKAKAETIKEPNIPFGNVKERIKNS